MVENEELLQAILDNPEDDAPRWIYADWLDDQGENIRAEFIRVQLERFQLFGDTPFTLTSELSAKHPRYDAVMMREASILAMHFQSFLEPYRKKGEPLQSRDSHAAFHRGFINKVWMRARTFLTKAKKLFRRFPCQHLCILQTSLQDLEEVVNSEWMPKLTYIEINGLSRLPQSAFVLGEARNLRHLQAIKLVDTYCSEEYLKDLAGPGWPNTRIVLDHRFGKFERMREQLKERLPFLEILEAK
jgi:uncharacterized protein (TIGR02996 family)